MKLNLRDIDDAISQHRNIAATLKAESLPGMMGAVTLMGEVFSIVKGIKEGHDMSEQWAWLVNQCEISNENSIANTASVIDPATKLEWKCAVEGKFSHDKAVEYFGAPDKDGFRLPTIDELKTLIDADAKVGNALENYACSFWSSSPYVDNAQYAWGVNFGDGFVGNGNRSYPYYVRLVRDGQ